MNSMIGKSTGIALLMAAALLAALFAMGVFSATGVGAHPNVDPPTDANPAHDNLASIAMTVNDDPDDDTDTTRDTVALPTSPADAAAGADHEFSVTIPRHATDLEVTLTAGGTSATEEWGAIDSFEISAKANGSYVTVTETASVTDSTAAGATFTLPLNDGIVNTLIISANDMPASGEDASAAGVYTITLNYGFAVNGSERTAGAGVSIDLTGITGLAAEGGQDIVVKLPKFGVPSSVDNTKVKVYNDATPYTPSDVTVDGTTITLTMGDPGEDGTALPDASTPVTRVRFDKAAGITNPLVANENLSTYAVTVEDPSANKHTGYGLVFREVSVSSGSGSRGKEITITGKGFGDGTATIAIADANGADSGYSATETATDGVFKHTLKTDVKNNDDVSVFKSGSNTIDATDYAGRSANTTARHSISSSFSISPENPIPGAPFTITLKDARLMPATGSPAVIPHPTVRVGSNMAAPAGVDGADVDNDDTNNNTWKYITPPGSSGSLRVRVGGLASADIDQTVTFGSNPLTLSVDTAVPGQSIDITGSGFGSGQEVDGTDGSSVTIGAKAVASANLEGETVDANGNVSLTVTVPDDVSPGTRSVVVIDASGRRGTASITVPKPTISIDPAESRRGEAITVTGTGFPANDVISITYNSRALADGNPGTNDVGGFVHTILVPTIASLGEGKSYKINASALINTDAPAATAVNHKISDATLSISPDTATSGSSVDVTGMNFRGLASVTNVTIAGQDVTPAGNVNADRNGTFTVTGVVVPLLNPNRYVVKVTAGGEEAIGYLTVSTEVASNAPADVFASLGDRLLRVWYLDRATQEWSFYDPAPEFAAFNSLTEVHSGQVVQIIISDGDPVDFQGMQLYQGTNPISLD